MSRNNKPHPARLPDRVADLDGIDVKIEEPDIEVRQAIPNIAPGGSEQEAQAVIQAGKDRRLKVCGEELNALLGRHRCMLRSEQFWVNGMPNGPAQIVLVAMD